MMTGRTERYERGGHRRPIGRTAIGLPVLALLAGCGGGGGSSGGAVGSTPAPPSYTALASATSSTPLATKAASYDSVRLNDAPVPTTTRQFTSVEISYDSASATYTLRGTPGGSTAPVTQSFGPADLTSNIAGLYTRNGSELRVFTGFTYASYGSWRTGASEPGNEHFTSFFFGFGVRTLPEDMPKTGSASYALQLFGDNNVGGTGTVTANFAAGTIAASLAPDITYGPGRVSNFATLSGTGSISAADSSFAATLTGDGYSAAMNGLFYGPQAAETGGAFTIKPDGPTGVVAAGAFLGRKN